MVSALSTYGSCTPEMGKRVFQGKNETTDCLLNFIFVSNPIRAEGKRKKKN